MAKFIPVDTFDIVIFGGTGDLSRRKLLPALYHRYVDGQIPEKSRIIGVSRTEMSDVDFRNYARDACKASTGEDLMRNPGRGSKSSCPMPAWMQPGKMPTGRR